MKTLTKQEYQRQWFKKKYHSDPEFKKKHYESAKKWEGKNREYVNARRMEYYYKRQDKEKKNSLEYFYKHREEMNKQSLVYYHKNKERLLQYNKEYLRKYARSSPEFPYDIRDSMFNVRIRDKNTCQWYGCGLTNKEAIIHVHHIFPRKEYPNLASVEQYMICYCWKHHNFWHKKRREMLN